MVSGLHIFEILFSIPLNTQVQPMIDNVRFGLSHNVQSLAAGRLLFNINHPKPVFKYNPFWFQSKVGFVDLLQGFVMGGVLNKEKFFSGVRSSRF
jgi:hypothetical protein